MNPLLLAGLAGLVYLYLQSRTRQSDKGAPNPQEPPNPKGPPPKPVAPPGGQNTAEQQGPQAKPQAISLVGLRGIPEGLDPSWFIRPRQISDPSFRFFLPEDGHENILMGFGWTDFPAESELGTIVQNAAAKAKQAFKIRTTWFEEEFYKVFTYKHLRPSLPTLASPYSRLIPASNVYPFGFERSREALAKAGMEHAMPRAICVLREGPISRMMAPKGENPFRVVYARQEHFLLHVAALFAIKHGGETYAFRNSLQIDIINTFVRSRNAAHALASGIE